MNDNEAKKIIDDLYENNKISREELVALFTVLLDKECEYLHQYLFSKARLTQMKYFGKSIYKRCLIEISNNCKNDCNYCGIRCSNKDVLRYRLNEEDILGACEKGYELGMYTFVLQGGEDSYYLRDEFTKTIQEIKKKFPDCAITLSLGEYDKTTYQKWFDAGADRYLLRHETANEEHYNKLHPATMSLENRKKCLYELKEIGYQVGAGFMVGSPSQTIDTLADDLEFLVALQPHMVGVGPFIPHKSSIYKDYEAGKVTDTLVLLAIIRLLLPQALLPATTALGTISSEGYESGVLAGANVVMLNLTPKKEIMKYELYDGKIYFDGNSNEREKEIKSRFNKMGYDLVASRGDHISIKTNN